LFIKLANPATAKVQVFWILLLSTPWFQCPQASNIGLQLIKLGEFILRIGGQTYTGRVGCTRANTWLPCEWTRYV